MQNPARTFMQKLDFNVDDEILRENNPNEIEGVRQVSRLIVGFFAGAATISALMARNSLVDVTFESENAITNTLEVGLETLGRPMLLAAGFSVAVIAEGVRIHKLASQRLDELSS